MQQMVAVVELIPVIVALLGRMVQLEARVRTKKVVEMLMPM